MSQISYKDAGVDIDAGNSFVENIKPLVKSARQIRGHKNQKIRGQKSG